MIVIAGTTGCVMVQYPIKVFVGALAKFKWLIKPPFHDLAAQVTILEGMATLARQQGLLALENEISKIDEPFLSKGIQMVVDGTDNHLRQLPATDLKSGRRPTSQARRDRGGPPAGGRNRASAP